VGSETRQKARRERRKRRNGNEKWNHIYTYKEVDRHFVRQVAPVYVADERTEAPHLCVSG
jgi:hypothetical protein